MNEILNGDCLELMDFIPNASIDMILCDLPYGTTACKWDTVIDFTKLWAQYERIIKPNGAIVLFGSEPFSSLLRTSNLKRYKYDWVWDKKNSGGGLLAKIQPLKVCELISVFSYGAAPYYPQMTKGILRNKKSGGSKKGSVNGYIPAHSEDKRNDEYFPKNIIEFSNAVQKGKTHPTQKPVALFEYLIKTYTNAGDLVLDNCAGSGTTAIACINTNRKFIVMEQDEKYFDIMKARITEHAELF